MRQKQMPDNSEINRAG